MGQYLYDKEAVIIELFGSFATAIAFDISGRILIRPESLSLKLRTDWPTRAEFVISESLDIKPAITDVKDIEPNLAKILAIGDRITFDAVACNNGLNGTQWIAAQCSVKIAELCTRTKVFTGFGKVVEVSQENGLLDFDGKKVFFISSAAFPHPVKNLNDAYKVGDNVSFVAIEQVHANEAYQWHALSVEISGSSSTVSTGGQSSSSLEPNSSHVSPPIAFPSPMSFSSSTSSGVFTGNRASPRRTDRSRSRSRSPVSHRSRGRGRGLPRDFDRDSYYSLPVSLRGYGRITYYGPRCSLLKDLESHRLVFFENIMVDYPSRCDRRHLVMGQVVSFKALRTTRRANLHCYYDAEQVVALDHHEEYDVIRKWDRDGSRSQDRRGSSSSNTENRSRSGSIRPRRRSPDRRDRRDLSDRRESCDGRNDGDLRERLSERRNHYIDRHPFGDKVEKVLFDRRLPDYDHIETRQTHGERKNFEIILEGDSRKCVVKTKNDNVVDEDAFMIEEESNAQRFEFDGDNAQ